MVQGLTSNVLCHRERKVYFSLCFAAQGNTCLENGSYLMNYLSCASCHQRDFVLISNKTTEDEDGEEIVTYDRK